MNFYKYLLILVLITGSSFSTKDPCTVSNNAFQEGEKITYKLYYNLGFVWLTAGTVEFTVQETEEHYIIEAHGKTIATYEWFFKVDDYFKSIIDKNTMLPVEFERDVHEGNYVMYNKIEFNQNTLQAVSHKGKTRESVETKTHLFDSCIHDILSTIYFLRNINFDNITEEENIPVTMIMDNDVYPLNVNFKGKSREKIKGLGKYDCIKISPELITGGIFEEGQEMNVWVSDDQNKIPLLIESPISVGSVKAVLKSYSGIKKFDNSQLK